MKAKTIALVSNNAWSVYNFRLDVIRYLLEEGYRVLVFAPDDAYSQRLRVEGCQFEPISFNNKSENPWKDFRFYRQLRALYRKHRPDFIFHYVAKPNIYGSLAAGAEGIPSVAVVTGLGYPFAKKNWLYFLIRKMYKVALRRAWEVWFLNNEDAKVFLAEEILPIDKIKVLPGEGVNTRHFRPLQETGDPDDQRKPQEDESVQDKEPAFRFLMSTRLLRSKGVGLYADAARILRRKHYNADFNLIGLFEKDHPDSISLEELRQWEQEGLIRFHGFTDDVRDYLSRADCFVFPSYYNEGVPRCLMEAASMALPVITSLHRGCKEVVLNNSNGFICQPNDPFDLADKMEKMMQLSEAERRRMGQNGRRLVLRKFEVGKIIAEYANTLISAFEHHHGDNRQDRRATAHYGGRV